MDKNTLLGQQLSEDEKKFLEIVSNPLSRPDLLARLEQLGLLSAFLSVESETI